MLFINYFIILFVLIIWVYYNKSYLITTTSLKNLSSIIFQGWVFLKFLLVSCHVMFFKNVLYQHYLLHVAVLLCHIIFQKDFYC